MPQTLDDVTDVAGARIVLLFERDVGSVCTIIEDTFEVVRKEDTRARLDVHEFGYGSIHYEVRAPSEWLKVPTLKPLSGLRCEIQVRTASQHIWAMASHVLQYKNETDVPPPLRRTIMRAAALLETVDLEFERVVAQREEYIASSPVPHEDLNTDSLKQLLNELWPEENRSDAEPYSELLENLRELDIDGTAALRQLIVNHRDAALQQEAELASSRRAKLMEGTVLIGTTRERAEKGVYFTHVGLTREVLSIALNVYFREGHIVRGSRSPLAKRRRKPKGGSAA